MELWQIAVLLDRHKLAKPEMPTAPDDWGQRVAMYQGIDIAALRQEQRIRSAERRAAKRKKARER